MDESIETGWQCSEERERWWAGNAKTAELARRQLPSCPARQRVPAFRLTLKFFHRSLRIATSSHYVTHSHSHQDSRHIEYVNVEQWSRNPTLLLSTILCRLLFSALELTVSTETELDSSQLIAEHAHEALTTQPADLYTQCALPACARTALSWSWSCNKEDLDQSVEKQQFNASCQFRWNQFHPIYQLFWLLRFQISLSEHSFYLKKIISSLKSM